jgi:hypothetical protein
VADLGRADHHWADRDSLDPCRAAHKQSDAPARTFLIDHVLGSKCGWSTVERWILRATRLYQSVLLADQGLLTAAGWPGLATRDRCHLAGGRAFRACHRSHGAALSNDRWFADWSLCWLLASSTPFLAITYDIATPLGDTKGGGGAVT